MNFRTAYDESVRQSKRGIVFEKPSRVKQSFKDECDVNNIMARYATTGVLGHVNTATPMSGDFTMAPADYQEAMALVLDAEEKFAALSSDVRKRFDNNPMNLLQFIQEPEKNYEEGVKLGLFNPKVVETGQTTRVVGNSDIPGIVSANGVSGVSA